MGIEKLTVSTEGSQGGQKGDRMMRCVFVVGAWGVFVAVRCDKLAGAEYL